MALPRGHYIHFKIDGRISASEYEKIKRLPYKDQIKTLMVNSSSVEVSADTKLDQIISDDPDEPG